MRYATTIVLLCAAVVLTATHSPDFTALQRDLGIQAAALASLNPPTGEQPKDVRSYQVGDQDTFWRWNLSVMPPTWVQTPATCRAVDEHSYVFVANSEWNVHMDQADVDQVLTRLEDSTVADPSQGAIEMDVSLFGPVPDALDNDPKLIVFYSALGSFQGNLFDGYFSPYNQVTEAQAQQMSPSGHSNECEMIYMTCYPLDPVAPVRLSVLAHELQHLIHWGADANEDSWLNEGCSELAMVAYGVPDPISGFPSNPDNNLTAWNQNFADYVKVMLFFTYLEEHYDAGGLISALVADPANGIGSLTNQILATCPGSNITQIFGNWAAANIIDADPPQNPLWGYAQLDLPSFSMTNLAAVPELSNQGIQAYASDYLKFVCQAEGQRLITLNCSSPVLVQQANFGISGQCLELTLRGYDSNFLLTPPLSSVANHVVWILSTPSGAAVTYSLSTVVGNDDPLVPPPAPVSLNANRPNPFRDFTEISFSLREAQHARLEIFNLKGELVCTLMDAEKAPGQHSASWDGRDGRGRALPAGIYLYRLSAGKASLTRKLLLRQ